ncbi:hypothetical protein ABIB99_001324 [Bradyrhizobium sp. LA6.1]
MKYALTSVTILALPCNAQTQTQTQTQTMEEKGR